MQFEFSLDHFSDVVAVGSSTCATAENVWRKVVNLLAVLVANQRATGGSCVSSESNSVLKILVNATGE